MASDTHTHPCRHCQQPVACDGTLERNHDGIPEVICTWYHKANGRVEDVLCEDCLEKLCPVCETNERPISWVSIRQSDGTRHEYRYRRCDDCEDGGELDYQAVTMQEQYERAAVIKRGLR